MSMKGSKNLLEVILILVVPNEFISSNIVGEILNSNLKLVEYIITEPSSNSPPYSFGTSKKRFEAILLYGPDVSQTSM